MSKTLRDACQMMLDAESKMNSDDEFEAAVAGNDLVIAKSLIRAALAAEQAQPDGYNRRLRQQLEQEWATLRAMQQHTAQPPAPVAQPEEVKPTAPSDESLRAMADALLSHIVNVVEFRGPEWLAGDECRFGVVGAMRQVRYEAAQQAAPVAQPVGETWVADATVYVLNERGTNRWWATVQPGQDDDGERVSDAECRDVAFALSKAAAPPQPTAQRHDVAHAEAVVARADAHPLTAMAMQVQQQAAPVAQQGEATEPDWSSSETGPLEVWKIRAHSMADRLLMADGAVAHWRKVAAQQTAVPVAQQGDAVDGLVWAIVAKDQREVSALFDTPEQANAFVRSLKVSQPAQGGQHDGKPAPANQGLPRTDASRDRRDERDQDDGGEPRRTGGQAASAGGLGPAVGEHRGNGLAEGADGPDAGRGATDVLLTRAAGTAQQTAVPLTAIPTSIIDAIGEYGAASRNSRSEPEIMRRWGNLIDAIRREFGITTKVSSDER